MIVNFDPVAFSIFGWGIHWYGLMYVLAFVSAFLLARLQTKDIIKTGIMNKLMTYYF